MAMIDVNDYPILKNAVCELWETSKTTHRGIEYMSQSTIKVVGFDEVKNQFVKNWGFKDEDKPKSNDAFYVCAVEKKMFFIEFRSGESKNILPQARQKIYDSLLILTDIIGKGISKIRENLNYILVLNDSMVTISGVLEKKADEKLELNNLRYFEGLYFNKVHIVSNFLFKEDFTRKWESPATS
jgi:hypothetical protein